MASFVVYARETTQKYGLVNQKMTLPSASYFLIHEPTFSHDFSYTEYILRRNTNTHILEKNTSALGNNKPETDWAINTPYLM